MAGKSHEPNASVIIRAIADGRDGAVAEYLARYKEKLARAARRALRRLGARETEIDSEGMVDIALAKVCEFGRRGGLDEIGDGDALLRLIVAELNWEIGNEWRLATASKRGRGRVFELGEDVASYGPGPESFVDGEEETLAFMGLLPDETHRTILQLRMDGLAVGKIAERLACSERTIERKLKRIRAIAIARFPGSERRAGGKEPPEPVNH